jgi:signal transduction histidine kinase/CheY-like chemotaxis protein
MKTQPILIVDDNESNLRLMPAVLDAEGYMVKSAMDADKALAVLESWQPRLILMDLQMPGIDGLELTRRLKRDPRYQNIIVLALAAGCDGYITKLIDTRRLATVVDRYLNSCSSGEKTPVNTRKKPRGQAKGRMRNPSPGELIGYADDLERSFMTSGKWTDMRVTKHQAIRLLSENGLSPGEIKRRKAFLDFGRPDAQRLAALAPLARRYAGEVIDEFYAHLLSFEKTRHFFRDPTALKRIKALQKRYFLRLTSGHYDEAYIADRLLVGAIHERIGLGVEFYLGAYRRYLDSVARRLLGRSRGARREHFQAFLSLLKIIFFDMGLAIDTYVFEREHTIRVKNEELAEQNRRVQEANRLKTEFLANMSHELRTPLNSIIGFSELLQDGKAGAIVQKQKDHLDEILASARHLLGLIDDVLDLAKIEAGSVALNPEPVDIAELLRETRQALEPQAAQKEIRMETEVGPNVPTPLLDRARLKQVLFNYLSNALKFTGKGGRVAARVRREGRELVIEVQDTGIGIREQDLPRLFVEFQQLDASAAKKYPGTGLGLAITRHMVEAQGGTVGVRSKPGRGSTFYARLPLGCRPARAEGVSNGRPQPTGS